MSAVTGKKLHLNRLIQAETNTCLIRAIDHGMTSPMRLDGLYDTRAGVAGAVVCSIGGNPFQYARPQAMLSAISRAFRDRSPAGLAREELKDGANGRVKP